LIIQLEGRLQGVCCAVHHSHPTLAYDRAVAPSVLLNPLCRSPCPCSAYLQQWHIACSMAAYFDNDTVALPGCAKFFKVRPSRRGRAQVAGAVRASRGGWQLLVGPLPGCTQFFKVGEAGGRGWR